MSGSLVPKTLGVTSVLVAIMTVSVSIRFFVRGFLLRRVDWDDGLVFISYCLAMVLCSLVLAMTNVGFGSHQEELSELQVKQFFKLQMVTPIAYIWGFVTVKMSFAVLYLRLLPDLFNRRVNQGLLVVLLAEGIEESLVIVFHCVPLAKVWDYSLEGECIDLKPFYYASFVVKFLTDVVLFVQPIPVIWKMQLSRVKRVGAIFMLSIGLFVCVVSIVRISYISSITSDFTYGVVVPMLWSMVEVASLVACSCVPSLRPFLRCFPAIDRALGLTTERGPRWPYKIWRSPHSNSLQLSNRSKFNRPRTGAQKPINSGPQTETETAISRPESTEEIRTGSSQELGGITVTRNVEVVVERIEDVDQGEMWRSPDGDEEGLVGEGGNDDTRDPLEVRPKDTSWLSMRL